MVAPRSKSLFPSGISLAPESRLDADDLARRALGTFGGQTLPEDPQEAQSSERINFSFKAKISGALEFTVQPGFAEIAPDVVIPVTCSIIQTVTGGASAWYGWVDVDYDAGTAVASFGDAWPTPLTELQGKTIRRRQIIQINLVDGKLNAIKNLQCGNIDVEPYQEVPPPDYATLELNTTDDAEEDNIQGALQLVDADTVVEGTVSFPTLNGPNEGDAPNTLKWVEIDGDRAAPDSSSLKTRAVSGEKDKLEIKGFSEHTDSEAGDLWACVMNNCSPGQPDVRYTGQANMKEWLDVKEPDDLTIEKNATAEDAVEGKLQMHGADTVIASSASLPIMRGPNVGATPSSLEWVEIDGENPAADGSSLAIRGSGATAKVEVKGFSARAEMGEIGSTDLAMINIDSTDPTPGYATQAAMKEWLAGDGTLLPWMCGYVISGTGVTLTAGYVFWGTGAPFSVASANVTITSNQCYGLEVTMSGAAWVSKSTPAGFVDEADKLRQFYYQFNLVGGKVVLTSIGAQGNWKIPGVFAPG